jgi:hypothetical protein
MLPKPFWTTLMAVPVLALAEIAPPVVTDRLAGVPTAPPDDVKSIASPLVVATLPWPVIAKLPAVEASALIVE